MAFCALIHFDVCRLEITSLHQEMIMAARALNSSGSVCFIGMSVVVDLLIDSFMHIA